MLFRWACSDIALAISVSPAAARPSSRKDQYLTSRLSQLELCIGGQANFLARARPDNEQRFGLEHETRLPLQYVRDCQGVDALFVTTSCR